MDAQSVYERLISRAANRIGGTAALSERLGIPHAKLIGWLEGREIPDMPTVLQIVEVFLDG